jgi:hypothetical protein
LGADGKPEAYRSVLRQSRFGAICGSSYLVKSNLSNEGTKQFRSDRAAAGDQVKDQDDHSYHQYDVNQIPTDMTDES